MATGATIDGADQIQFWTGSKYETYYLVNWGPAAGKWVDFLTPTTPSTFPVPAGSAAWYLSRNAAVPTPVSVTVAGQVATDAIRPQNIETGMNIVAHPYPTDYAINSQDWVAMGGTAGATIDGADQIQFWTGSKYETYYLVNWGPAAGKWVDFLTPTTPAAAIIPFGTSAWYISKDDFTWNAARPFDYP